MHTPDELIPEPPELVPRNRTPETIAGWRAVADGYLSDPCCAFHRNVEISSCYAWIYRRQPACFKWAAMAAIASHHIRLVLFPLRLDTDRTGFVDIPHSLTRRKLLLTGDVDTIRATNNAIFNDIFWVHLAYVTAGDGIERLRALLQAERQYASVLAGFEAIDQGRRVLADATAPRQPGRPRVISSGRATSSSSGTSSAPWCNPASITSRARSPGSSRSARPRASRCTACGGRWRPSPRSTSTRSAGESRTLCGRRRGRGSPASTTAGAGS
jgi:hypothetical protein